jgi:hypothetical protein
MITPLVCDLTGRTQTWLWLLHTFGRVEVHAATPRPGQPLYRITRLSAGVTGQLLTATVLDEEGRRLPHIRVVRVWTGRSDSPEEQPTANPQLGVEDPRRPSKTPSWGPLVGDPRWRRGRRSPVGDCSGDDVVPTDAEGLAQFPTGAADLYTPPARGGSTLWISDTEAPSDAISGIGILQSDLGLRLCLHVTWKRMRGPRPSFPPRGTP